MTASVIQRHVNLSDAQENNYHGENNADGDEHDTTSCISHDGDSSTASGSSPRFKFRVWDRVANSIRGIDSSSHSCSQPNSNNTTAASTQNLMETRRHRRRLEHEEKERQRRYEQFKRDEAVVMEVMNKKLEQEQRALHRKREAKEKKQQQAKQSASRRNHKRQDDILLFLEKDNHLEVISPTITGTSTTGSSPSRRNSISKNNDNNTELNQDSGRSNGSTDTAETLPEDGVGEEVMIMTEDEDEDGGYSKTIRWCSSVDRELARRDIHRQTNPTRPGGLARRVRRLNTSKVDTFRAAGMYIEEEEENDVQEDVEAAKISEDELEIKVINLNTSDSFASF